jgi:hypothetical protein
MLKSLLITVTIVVTSQSASAQQAANVFPTPRPPSELVLAYVSSQRAPANSVQMTELVTVGNSVPENLMLSSIPASPEYAFLFVNQKRVIVDSRSRVVVQILD